MAAPMGNKNHLKHGMRGTRLYNIWRSMRQRCYNPKTINYHNYGGRGITVCEEWRNDFMNFYQWAMSTGYSDGLTIDRKDTDGNYEPSNCKWATYKQQSNNKRNSKYIEFRGESRTISEWADIVGISYKVIWSRIKSGWSVEDALTRKVV